MGNSNNEIIHVFRFIPCFSVIALNTSLNCLHSSFETHMIKNRLLILMINTQYNFKHCQIMELHCQLSDPSNKFAPHTKLSTKCHQGYLHKLDYLKENYFH